MPNVGWKISAYRVKFYYLDGSKFQGGRDVFHSNDQVGQKRNPDMGMFRLKKMIEKRSSEISRAVIYRNPNWKSEPLEVYTPQDGYISPGRYREKYHRKQESGSIRLFNLFVIPIYDIQYTRRAEGKKPCLTYKIDNTGSIGQQLEYMKDAILYRNWKGKFTEARIYSHGENSHQVGKITPQFQVVITDPKIKKLLNQ